MMKFQRCRHFHCDWPPMCTPPSGLLYVPDAAEALIESRFTGVRRGNVTFDLNHRNLLRFQPKPKLVAVNFARTRKQTETHTGAGMTQEDRFDFEHVMEDLKERQQRYMNVCQTVNLTSELNTILIYRPAGLAVCLVPKAGCTFWKRVFYFLYNDTGVGGVFGPANPVITLFDVTRAHAHFGRPQNIGQMMLHYDNASDRGELFRSKRVMFARDPWRRLWSSYVDKFVLPDSWSDEGKRILRMRERLYHKSPQNRSRLESVILFKGNTAKVYEHHQNRSKERRMCADDISFAEFLFYALTQDKDLHWSPVHHSCNPCVLKPQVVGTTETFFRDTQYVMSTSGLGHLLPKYNHFDHVTDEVRQMINYHFHHWRIYKDLHNCLDLLGLAKRLWMAFQYNGYIRQDSKFPEENLRLVLQNSTAGEASRHVTHHVMKALSGKLPSESEWKWHRREVMISAYRKIPSELLKLIQDRFKWDFDLFGYDSEPEDIFKSYQTVTIF